MGQLNTHPKTEKPHLNGFKPVIIEAPKDDEAEKYWAALALVEYIDATLIAGTQHYRTKSGRLLRTLDEVVNAILADNLVWETESTSWDQDLARAA